MNSIDVRYIPDNNFLNIFAEDVVKDIRVSCNTENITVDFQTTEDRFNGLIYPKGLSKNSTCMAEYIKHNRYNCSSLFTFLLKKFPGIILIRLFVYIFSKVTYVIPLRLCNTMSVDVEDGVEFFNTIVLQPHRKLVTNQGRGYHIRCRYRTEEKTLLSNFDVE